MEEIFNPNWYSPPGDTIRDILEEQYRLKKIEIENLKNEHRN